MLDTLVPPAGSVGPVPLGRFHPGTCAGGSDHCVINQGSIVSLSALIGAFIEGFCLVTLE